MQCFRELVQGPLQGVAQGGEEVTFCDWRPIAGEVTGSDLLPGEFGGFEGLTIGVVSCYALACHGSDSFRSESCGWVSWC
jgi:hypothetical protein